MNSSLYDRVGGKSAVQAAVNIFYDKFIGNQKVSTYFQGISMESQAKILQRFITMVFKGDKTYSHSAMRNAHAPLVKKGLNDSHMDIFIETMTETLNQLDIPIEFIEEFVEIAESYRDDVLVR